MSDARLKVKSMFPKSVIIRAIKLRVGSRKRFTQRLDGAGVVHNGLPWEA